jgi:hypothetical protein
VRTSLSALLDDEEPVCEPATVRIHIRRCARCAQFASAIRVLDRQISRSSGRLHLVDPYVADRIARDVLDQ